LPLTPSPPLPSPYSLCSMMHAAPRYSLSPRRNHLDHMAFVPGLVPYSSSPTPTLFSLVETPTPDLSCAVHALPDYIVRMLCIRPGAYDPNNPAHKPRGVSLGQRINVYGIHPLSLLLTVTRLELVKKDAARWGCFGCECHVCTHLYYMILLQDFVVNFGESRTDILLTMKKSLE